VRSDRACRLPAGFEWGVATAAFQIEGGWDADGKAPSVWDAVAHGPVGLMGGATGDVTGDHYHRWEEDLDLLARLGVSSYRFSLSWPRLQPDGRGPWNEPGFAFYDRLIDGLLARGIAPAVTVYHWDHPLAVEERGGWLDRDTSHRLADVAGEAGRRFGDRVARWMTLNEPLSVMTGYTLGFSRPDGAVGLEGGLRVAHHQLLAHGESVAQLRAAGVVGDVGIAVNVAGVQPGDDSASAYAAAARAEVLEDRIFLDPLLLGRYPLLDGEPVIAATDEELAIISTPIDFLGLNWYCPTFVDLPEQDAVRPAPTGTLLDLFVDAPAVFGYRRTDVPDVDRNVMGWPVSPKHFGVALDWLASTYPHLPPLFITENGFPRHDVVTSTGAVDDAERIVYLNACFEQIETAIAAGVDIRGYYVWSLLDNLEWGLGFGPRFGLVHVDFDNLRRTPKASFHWYARLIAAHRAAERGQTA
jgi:beta-glucosidase